MTDAFDQIGKMMGDADEVWRLHPKFFLYEPYDVKERPQWVRDLAARDSADINNDDIIRCCGMAPRPFQVGYHLSAAYGRTLLAGSQQGKSLAVSFDILMRSTGEIPFSLRYAAGHDTGILREISPENVIRWGRRSKDDGQILDHNPRAHNDGSWDCGTVIGVGVFPRERIVPEGSMIRLISWQTMISQNWWPAFTGQTGSQLGRFVPGHLIDKTEGASGHRGFHVQEKLIHLQRGVRLKMLTYEAERRGLEGVTVPTYLDEEPPKEELWGALVTHAEDWSLSETPWLGITWSRKVIFPDVVTDHRKTFQACAYDCPYKTPAELERTRHELEAKQWEIGARMWGIPTNQTGEPYYDRDKINFWINRFKVPFRLVRFEPTAQWGGIKTNADVFNHPGLLDTPVRLVEAREEDEQSVWRLYEDRLDGTGYVGASDQAEGADTPEEAGDRSTCVIARQHEDDKTMPICAATLRSTLPVYQFAREVMYAARYFHNALLAPETGRGSANEAFKSEARDWPHWFKDTMIRQSTRKPKEYMGYCPTTDRRDAVYDRLIRNWLDRYDADQYPNCPDEWVLREAASAIVSLTRGGIKKCDHPPGGTIDSLTSWGILLFVMAPEYNRQIKYHGSAIKEKQENWLERAQRRREEQSAGPVFLGEGMKEFR